MAQRKTLYKLTWLTFMPLLLINSYFVMLLNFSCDGFKYYVVYSWGYCLFIKYGHSNRCPYKQSMILADR
ncbi:hypothetical protein DKN91_12265 [Escherichia coli]|jgi:hypothetical protein|nr:hypothetical protein [Escherichia coli]EEW3260886.1 hypothetical protein [Escherichia coli]EEY5702039.1 hypothetical protein [Escherichia coli]EFB2467505.1 hypothetical protein [Escherichia coli]EFB2817709.1 hypothetical protein [Escherichia coli]